MLLKVFTKNYFTCDGIWFSWGSIEYTQNWIKWNRPFFRIPSIINDENDIISPGQLKKPVFILSDKFCEEQAFPYL